MAANRRKFLQAGAGAAALLSFADRVPQFVASMAAGASLEPELRPRSLVVLQLAGGNDGLNTVVPYDDDQYHRHRPTLRLRRQDLHPIAEGLGFHPQMKAFHRLWHEGQLSIVQGAGYPNQDRSHSRSMHIWQSAQLVPEEAETGWIGRLADLQCQREIGALPVVFVGKIRPEQALSARQAIVPHLRDTADALPRTAAGLQAAARAPRQANTDAPLLEFVRRTDQAASDAAQRIETVLRQRPERADRYPQYALARSLRCLAELMRAELPIAVYYVELGGQEPGAFDTHANQAGNHAALLAELAESVAAFVDDLARDHLLDRVLLMTFSEFGRSLAENGRHGTDHGAAAPLFVAGGARQCPLVGRRPNLTQLDGNAPRFDIDFRRVYATVLDRWLGVDSRQVLGGDFEHVDLLYAG